MKKAILMLLLLVMSTGAMAEWVKAGENGQGDEFFIDPNSVRKDGHLRRAWEIFNPKRRDENGVASFRTLAEYDCNSDRYRVISFSIHSEPMAGGKTIRSFNSSGEWIYIPPGNGNARHVLGFLCEK